MTREHSSLRRLAVVLFLAVHALLLLYGIRCHFATRNEVAHVPAGLAVWKTGTFTLYRVNPPLPRLLAVLPVLAAQPNTDFDDLSQLFKDVKEVWGAGQQQVRNVYASIGAWTVNLVLYSVVEGWAWARAEERLVDRSRCPWDREDRRPSHADERKAVQGEILSKEIQAVLGQRTKREQFQELAMRLLHLAA